MWSSLFLSEPRTRVFERHCELVHCRESWCKSLHYHCSTSRDTTIVACVGYLLSDASKLNNLILHWPSDSDIEENNDHALRCTPKFTGFPSINRSWIGNTIRGISPGSLPLCHTPAAAWVKGLCCRLHTFHAKLDVGSLLRRRKSMTKSQSERKTAKKRASLHVTGQLGTSFSNAWFDRWETVSELFDRTSQFFIPSTHAPTSLNLNFVYAQ